MAVIELPGDFFSYFPSLRKKYTTYKMTILLL